MIVPALTATGIVKEYVGVRALQGVNLALNSGEIHAILGENGSGKSTLLSVISGAQKPDAGSIFVAGANIGSLDPRRARQLGIAFVQQEPQLAPTLTVGENMMMGRIPKHFGLVNWMRMHAAAQEVIDTLGISVRSKTLVRDLTASRRQLVEIAKGLVGSPRILLLDEATSSLDNSDVKAFFRLLVHLRANGTAIAFISHKMTEVMQIADRVTVLRDGRYVGTSDVAKTNERQLVKMMVGRELEDYWHKASVPIGERVLEVESLIGGPIRDISLHVRAGEIVGLAGLVGSGRSALLRNLIGANKPTGGRIILHGKTVRIRNPTHARRLRIGYVPEDRKSEGLIMGWSILRNSALSIMSSRAPFAILTRKFDENALARGSRGLRIKAKSSAQSVGRLSGGNQQKVVIARELASTPGLLLLDEPTRGVDVGAKEDIYAQLANLVATGMGLLIVSSELLELLGICDRIYVMHGGTVVAEFDASSASEEKLAFHASGAHEMRPSSRSDLAPSQMLGDEDGGITG